MPAKRRALGRGLDALLPSSGGAQTTTAVAPNRAVEEIELDSIVPNPYQPRKAVAETELQELADSIRAQGVIQPIILRRIDTRYQLVAGERRWRASRMAGLLTVPAIVFELTEHEMLEWALLENIQREDLNAIEEAHAYQTLIHEFGLSQEEIAQRVGKQRSSVANALRLLKLPEIIQEQIADGKLTAGHGRALLTLSDPAEQRLLHEEILRREMSVREAEQYSAQRARKDNRHAQAEKDADPQLEALAGRLSERLGTKAAFRSTGKAKGRLELYYYSLDDLDRIIEIIMGSEELGI